MWSHCWFVSVALSCGIALCGPPRGAFSIHNEFWWGSARQWRRTFRQLAVILPKHHVSLYVMYLALQYGRPFSYGDEINEVCEKKTLSILWYTVICEGVIRSGCEANMVWAQWDYATGVGHSHNVRSPLWGQTSLEYLCIHHWCITQ